MRDNTIKAIQKLYIVSKQFGIVRFRPAAHPSFEVPFAYFL